MSELLKNKIFHPLFEELKSKGMIIHADLKSIYRF